MNNTRTMLYDSAPLYITSIGIIGKNNAKTCQGYWTFGMPFLLVVFVVMHSLRLVCAGLQLAQGECGWNWTAGYRDGVGDGGWGRYGEGGQRHFQGRPQLTFTSRTIKARIYWWCGTFCNIRRFPGRAREREREREGREREIERRVGERGVRTARAVGSACNWAHAGSCELMTSRVQAKAAPARIISWGRLPP